MRTVGTVGSSLACCLAASSPLFVHAFASTTAARSTASVQGLNFLTPELTRQIRSEHGSPVYAYDMTSLKANAAAALAFPNAYGLTARFAMKALPNQAILQILLSMGVHIDASSGWEVKRAMAAGFPASHISMSTQELPSDFADLLSQGAIINCCSLSQLEKVGKAAPGARVGVRFNPGMGSGGTGKTNVGGPGASFGIWHEQVPEVKAIAEKYNLDIFKVHTHIGSGSDPEVWQRVSGMSLKLVEAFPSVTTLNLGGGYKVGRMPDEKTTDLQVVGAPVQAAFEKFAADTGRKLRLEIEPGTFMVANVGSLVCTVQDKVSTGTDGHTFLKLDAGMTDLLRPSLYGAQHPIVVVPSEGTRDDVESVVVVGHCCESGDLLTPAPGAPEDIAERVVNRAEIGDICVVEGCGAYTSSMSTKNYNSFPEIPEVLVDEAGNVHLVRERQEVTQIWQNERPLPKGLV